MSTQDDEAMPSAAKSVAVEKREYIMVCVVVVFGGGAQCVGTEVRVGGMQRGSGKREAERKM